MSQEKPENGLNRGGDDEDFNGATAKSGPQR
jgi:hypothetical protein